MEGGIIELDEKRVVNKDRILVNVYVQDDVKGSSCRRKQEDLLREIRVVFFYGSKGRERVFKEGEYCCWCYIEIIKSDFKRLFNLK